MTDQACPVPSRWSLSLHLLRGAVGIACVLAAMRFGHPGNGILGGFAALAFVVIAMVAFRGCPMCWTMGLVERMIRLRVT